MASLEDREAQFIVGIIAALVYAVDEFYYLQPCS